MALIESIFGYLIGIFTILWLYQFWDGRNRRLPPGPLRIPLLGNILQIQQADGKYPYKALTKLWKKYGDIIFLQIGVVNAVVFSGYDTVKRALNEEEFLNRLNPDWFLHHSFGKRIGIFAAPTETWKPTRKFAMRNLRDFGFGKTNFQQKFVDIEMQELTQTLNQAIEQNNGIIQPHTLFGVPSLNITWAAAANVRFDHKDPQIRQLVTLLGNWLENTRVLQGAPAAYPFLLKWFPSYFSTKIISDIDDKFHAFLKNHIDEIRERGTYKTEPDSFIDVFLQQMESDKIKTNEDREVFSEEALISTLYTLFMAGSDTTSNTMTFALQKLAMYPEVQERLRHELETVVGNERIPTLSDRPSLPYTRAVILELHRHNHVAPLAPRKVYKDTAFDEFVIPAESLLVMNLYSVLMDEDFWGDPQNFRPSRFLDDENNIINAERVIVFSAGKRNCAGEITAESTIFAFITQLVQKYEFLPAKGGQVFVTDPIMSWVLSPVKFDIKVRKRQ